MKIKLRYNKLDMSIIGYTLVGETKKDKYILNAVRNLHFFDTIKYDGRDNGCEEFVGDLKFIKEPTIKDKIDSGEFKIVDYDINDEQPH